MNKVQATKRFESSQEIHVLHSGHQNALGMRLESERAADLSDSDTAGQLEEKQIALNFKRVGANSDN
jgi:hypothetical protein